MAAIVEANAKCGAFPQRLKPDYVVSFFSTSEVVPFQDVKKLRISVRVESWPFETVSLFSVLESRAFKAAIPEPWPLIPAILLIDAG